MKISEKRKYLDLLGKEVLEKSIEEAFTNKENK